MQVTLIRTNEKGSVITKQGNYTKVQLGTGKKLWVPTWDLRQKDLRVYEVGRK